MDFDPYEVWLGIPADHRPYTHYDLLGLASHEPEPAVIEIAALRRMGKVRLHQDGPHADRVPEVLEKLARARTVLIDSDLRAEFDAELKLRQSAILRSSPALDDSAAAVMAIDESEQTTTLADDFGSLVITEQPGTGPLRGTTSAFPPPPWWKKAMLYAAMLGSHLLLLGCFLLYVTYAPNFNGKWPWSSSGEPDAEETKIAAPSPEARLGTAPPENAWKTAVPGRASAHSLQVKPVFFVPQSGREPSQQQKKALNDHLAWCQTRFSEMLNGRDTFTLEPGLPLIHRSRTSLAELKAAPEMGAPRIAGELLAATKSNRLECPFIFVAVVMNAADNFPSGGGRPFNGGFNTGGGIVALSSFALDQSPNFQSTLEHELGHAFGLPHIDVYGQSMAASESIMSYNTAHHTRGMKPAVEPGKLVREDLVGLAFNRRAFPRLAADRARVVPPGTPQRRLVPLGPMTIDGQPPYELAIRTESGETFGTKISNIIHNSIAPSAGGSFDSTSMWQSAASQSGVASVIVTFPLAVTLIAIGVHSEHTGSYNAADHVQVEAFGTSESSVVADSPLQAPDVLVPLVSPNTAKTWRVSFHAVNKKEVTLRGIQFFTRYGELFPPQVPASNDAGFRR
jgi:hypothetical protein